MKILHICISGLFVDGLSYQENLLTQYHKNMGCEVSVITCLKKFDSQGNYTYDAEPFDYVNEHGVHVIKLDNAAPRKLGRLFRVCKGTYEAICNEAPDVIFVHGVQFADIAQVVKYVRKHPEVRVYVDNHADFSNSARNFISKNIQHKMLWRHYAKKINPYVKKFYGVLPARVDFLAEMYGLPKDKIELLVMGADDELVEKASAPEVRTSIREKYGIGEDDFLIMFGGKIDAAKKQILLLMDAVNALDADNVKLIVFGSVTEELKEAVESRCSDKVQYIGWVKSEDSYDYFAASDLVVFPGRHSVFWEQVAGQGIPMVVKHWEGTTHVDCGGNVKFLYKDSAEEIKEVLEPLVKRGDEYLAMKKAAEEKGKETFSYRDIAKRSIEE